MPYLSNTGGQTNHGFQTLFEVHKKSEDYLYPGAAHAAPALDGNYQGSIRLLTQIQQLENLRFSLPH
jgi:hypothetical protein